MSHVFDPRMTAYFGDAVLSAGFLPTPHLFLRHYVDLGLDSTLAMFVLQLMETTWDLGTQPRTSRDFAQRMGVGTKAIQRYSSRIEALGLVNIIAQFDTSGAQVENRYDLSPLFQRLAALVADRSCHQERSRQSRQTIATQHQLAQLHCQPDAEQLHAPCLTPPASDTQRPERQIRQGPSGQLIPHDPDRSIQGSRIDRSRLKETLRINNKQQEHAMHDTSQQQVRADPENSRKIQQPGWSIRQRRLLTSDEIAISQTLLTRMSIDNPVRTRIAEAVAPEDIWALRVHSMAKGWSPALTVTQVYDKRQKQVQLASDLERKHYELGAMLATLDLETAETMIELVMHYCPNEPQRLMGVPLLESAAPSLLGSVECLWYVVAELRGCPQARLPGLTMGADPAVERHQDKVGGHAQIWQGALRDLECRVPQPEFITWLESSVLLDLDDQPDHAYAVIGVPNIFARDTVIRMYLPLIEAALAVLLGKATDVQVELAANQSMSPGLARAKSHAFTGNIGDGRQKTLRHGNRLL